MANILLHGAYCLSQLLCNRLAAQRLHVEVVGPRREDQERNDSHFTVLRLHSKHTAIITTKLITTVRMVYFANLARQRYVGCEKLSVSHWSYNFSHVSLYS